MPPRLLSQRQLKLSHLSFLGSLVAIGYALAQVAQVGFEAATASYASPDAPWIQQAVLGQGVSVRSSGRGIPEINLSDGREVLTSYEGPEELTRTLQQNSAQPLSLASADFDEDGVPDLISGYAGAGTGIVTLLRGNVDSLFPNSPEARRRKAEGAFTDALRFFRPPACSVCLNRRTSLGRATLTAMAIGTW